MATSVTNVSVPPWTPESSVWYVKQSAPPGFGSMLSRRTIACDNGGFAATAVVYAIELRYSLCVFAASHVYSTYTMFPSPLMSPNIFNTLAVDPFAKFGG